MVAVSLGFVIYPIIEGRYDVIDSDWPAFATGGRLIVQDPHHLYDFETQRRAQLDITYGRSLVTLGIHGILPFLAPAWVAFLTAPFELLGTDLGGRLWILFGLACLALGLFLAVRPRSPTALLPAFASAQPAFASVPTALLLLNAQLDGLVVLGVGAAIALWSRPWLAGLCLGLTLVKPQLVLPLGAALLLTRQWRVVAAWAIAGIALFGASTALSPRWMLDWLSAVGGTVAPGSREIDLAHFGTLLPASVRSYAVAILSLVALAGVLALAHHCRKDWRSAAAVLVAGGVLVAPHALPTDLVLVAAGLAIWGKAAWLDWLLLSLGAAVAAVLPAPVPAAVGVLLVGWLCLRAAGLSGWQRGPASQAAG